MRAACLKSTACVFAHLRCRWLPALLLNTVAPGRLKRSFRKVPDIQTGAWYARHQRAHSEVPYATHMVTRAPCLGAVDRIHRPDRAWRVPTY
ncbi:hypothetical protein XFF6991_340006 [Xanthomonas phaseoli pv. phaseoli]|uniref:Uncharacterized protein n=1 Tax=Xanthomonas campestris pv. phaseoli TaxID=317013 RepID=A0A7Z7J0T6_XANCH|nr:hypothetical protein XFF6991_340006 [Xanthomonas phaseoli pv. phaseoli]